jgi:protein-S-isoprenylcysteine O-methyltransferase Ste14
MSDNFFHLSFIGLFVVFAAIRAYYHRQAVQTRGKAEFKEGGWLHAVRLVVGIPFMTLIVAYMIQPGLMAWAKFTLPQWTQWAGIGMVLVSLVLLVWVQRALGSNFSTTLHVREEHTLVTYGPYRWVRHPMYTVLYLILIGVFLVTQNWFIGAGFLIPLTLIVAMRLDNEEAAMIEKFGDDYRQYMKRTGRFAPRVL